MQVLKDGMQHMGKLICSNLGARMDSEPKRWRILGLYFSPSFVMCNICVRCKLCYIFLISAEVDIVLGSDI